MLNQNWCDCNKQSISCLLLSRLINLPCITHILGWVIILGFASQQSIIYPNYCICIGFFLCIYGARLGYCMQHFWATLQCLTRKASRASGRWSHQMAITVTRRSKIFSLQLCIAQNNAFRIFKKKRKFFNFNNRLYISSWTDWKFQSLIN